MNCVQLPLVAAMLSAAAISLVGCGGGGTASASGVTTVAVSPSLGKFSAGAHVTLKNASGISLGTAKTTDAGTAIIDIGGYTGPLVIEVTGDTGVTYYDEGANQTQAFDAAAVLRAITPSVAATVGVTAATNASVESIKSGNGGAIPATITADAINVSNNKIAVALGIADVLQAPKLVDASTLASAPLDVANGADKYALQLAALAKLASTGKTALDVAVDIAKDLQDGLLDGTANGAAISGRSTTYTQATVVADMAANVVKAAANFGTTNTQTVVASNPAVVGTVTPDVTKVVATSPAVALAKNLFAELRTTLSSFANSSKTGFLDTQAARASDDLKQVVAPEADRTFNRLSTIGLAIKSFESAQTGGPANGGSAGKVTIAGLPNGSAWIHQDGSLDQVLATNTGLVQFCYTILPASASSVVTCLSTAAPALNAKGLVKLVKYVLTPSATVSGQFTYTADRENRTWDSKTATLGAAVIPTNPTIPGGTGTITKTGTTGFRLAGTLPPSAVYDVGTLNAGNFATGVDTLDLSATKTALSSTSSRYALNGSIATTSLDFGKTVTLSLESGSYIDMDETNLSTTGTQASAFNIIGTAKTAATKLTGSFNISGLTKDKTGASTIANSIVFNGLISDTSTGGAGDILTGKLEASVTGYGNYDSTMPTAGSNYIHATVSFTGTVQAPSRPLMKLVTSGTTTGANDSSATVNYSYGTVSIVATGTSSFTAGKTVTITNQDGIQIVSDPNAVDQQLITTKAGTKLATVSMGVINYVDGSTEAWN